MFFAPPAAATSAEGLKEVADYLKASGAFGGSLDTAGLRYVQGWFTMKAMVEGLRNAVEAKDGGDVEGPDIKAGLEKVNNFETGVGPSISFSGTDHSGIDATPLYQVKNGKWEKLTDVLTP
jgi:branched-chain amino acid transport system substrate-binding protein